MEENQWIKIVELLRNKILLGLLGIFGVLNLFGQTTISPPQLQGIVPPIGPYQRCQQIYFVGHEIYDFVDGCDSMIFQLNPPGGTTFYRYRASSPSGGPSSGGPFNYAGHSETNPNPASVPKDTVYWTIPTNWPDGTYSVYFHDNEGCDGTFSNSNTMTFSVSGSVGTPTPFDLGYPGGGIYCIGETNPTPVNTFGALTLHTSGTYSDLTSSGPGNNAIFNTTTGEIGLHSGVAGVPHVIQYSNTFTGCGYVDTILVKAVTADFFDLGNTTFCKNVPTVSPVTPPSVGGTYTLLPNIPGALNTSTGDITTSFLTAGSYQLLYTPHIDTCKTPFPVNFSLTELDSAIFYYKSEYCSGVALSGWPDSIRALPLGFFRPDSSGYNNGLGLVVDSTSGKIDLIASVADTFVIAYQPFSPCSVIKRDTVVIRAPMPAFLFMDSVVCSDYGILFPTSFSPNGGPFQLVSGFLDPPNPTTGAININASQPGGPYFISMGNGDTVCPATIQKSITILQKDSAAVTYPVGPFCQNGADPVPFFTYGQAGGTFVINNGAVINDSTGSVDVSASPAGTHTVTYQTGGASCADTLVVGSVKVDAAPNAIFNLTPTSVCKSPGGLVPIDSVPSAPGSSFWVTTLAGVMVPGAVGGQNLVLDSLPPGGPYRLVREAILIGCRDTFVDFFVVYPEENAAFEYIPDRYCTADQDPSPLLYGNGGGTFNNDSTSTLIINDSTGVIDLDLSRGTHLIRYITNGACPDTAYNRVFVENANSPLFSFENDFVCLDTTSRILVELDTLLYGQGTFSITAMNANATLATQAFADAALDVDSGNVDMGLLYLAMDGTPELPDTFLVTLALNLQVGACTDSFSRLLYVFEPDSVTSTLTYPGDKTYCTSEDTTVAILTGTTINDGNFFSSPPNLIWQLRDSGVVQLSNTPAGTYEITFVKRNSCRDVLRDTITVEEPTANTLIYLDSLVGTVSNVFCHGDTVPAIAQLGTPAAGSFSFISGDTTLNVVFLAGGDIDLINSDPGNYVITFSESAGCPGTATATFILQPGPINTSVDIEPSDTFCVGTPIKIISRGGAIWNVMINGDTIGNSKELIYPPIDTIVWPPLAPGVIISVAISDQNECTVIDTVIPTINPIPDGIPTIPTVAINGQNPIQIPMTTTADETSFIWNVTGRGSIDNFSITSDSTNAINVGQSITIESIATLVSSITPGVATFYIRPNAKGCIGEIDTVEIKINPNDLAIFIPEVFTPDGNTFNDTWEIQWSAEINKDDFEILVYNRQGGQVFYMPTLSSDWNGGNLPDGVYWYNLRSKLTNETVQKGGVTIRRR